MTAAHVLLAVLATTGVVLVAWMLREAGRVARARGNVDRLAVAVVPMTALAFLVVGALTVREVLVSEAAEAIPAAQARPEAARFVTAQADQAASVVSGLWRA